MLHLALCILEVMILLMVARIIYVISSKSGYMTDLRMSNPGIAAAIGNASNRNFENSHIMLGGMVGYATNKAVANNYNDHLSQYLNK